MSLAIDICDNSSQYEWRMNKAELEIENMWKKIDKLMLILVGILASSVTTLLGVAFLIKGG